MNVIYVKIDEKFGEMLQEARRAGHYSTMSDFIRHTLRNVVENHNYHDTTAPVRATEE